MTRFLVWANVLVFCALCWTLFVKAFVALVFALEAL